MNAGLLFGDKHIKKGIWWKASALENNTHSIWFSEYQQWELLLSNPSTKPIIFVLLNPHPDCLGM